jgi:hypothetical protein
MPRRNFNTNQLRATAVIGPILLAALFMFGGLRNEYHRHPEYKQEIFAIAQQICNSIQASQCPLVYISNSYWIGQLQNDNGKPFISLDELRGALQQPEWSESFVDGNTRFTSKTYVVEYNRKVSGVVIHRKLGA